MARYILYTLFMLAVLSPLHVAAFSGGKVESSCTSMLPNHGPLAQTSSAPYSLVLSKSTYSAGEKITVTLSSNTSGSPFAGFLIQARSGNSTTPLGSFETSNSNTQTLKCTNSSDAVSHTSKSEKSSIQVTWVAPTSNAGDIQLRATVVKAFTQYWTGVVSSKLSYLAPSTTSTTVSTTKGSTSDGSTSKQSTNTGSTSKQNTSTGSTSKQSTSTGSTSKQSTSTGSTSKQSTSTGSTSKQSTSGGSTSKGTTSGGRGFQFSVPALLDLLVLAFITVTGFMQI